MATVAKPAVPPLDSAHCAARGSESISHRADSVRYGGGVSEARSRPAPDFAHAQARPGSFDSHQDGQRPGEGPDRLSRAAQRRARTRQGRHPFPSQRHARRSEGARRVDDLEDRDGERSVRRRQGWRHLRPQAHVQERTGAHDAPLRQRNSAAHRPDPAIFLRPTSTPTRRPWRGSWTPTR